jgi:two-component system sensor histidine kinase UhpB
VLLANGAGVTVAAMAAGIAGARIAQSGSPGALAGAMMLLAIGVGCTVLLTGFMLALALRPLRELQQTALRVQSGDLDARAPVSPLADDALEKLVNTFNGALDAAAAHRRRLRDSAARAQVATEEERQRVARELHDGIAQTLAALRIQLRLARAAREPDLRDQKLEHISTEIAEAIEEVRRIARGLRPPALETLGLAVAIESFAKPLAAAAGLQIEMRTSEPSGLSRDAELTLYRIMQEALSNVVRHSGASRVKLMLTHDHRTAELHVEDDGCGFRVTEAMDGDGRGLGLFGMWERAASAGGELTINSEPGRGTRITVTVPIEAKNA